jgi:hypothetical protein
MIGSRQGAMRLYSIVRDRAIVGEDLFQPIEAFPVPYGARLEIQYRWRIEFAGLPATSPIAPIFEEGATAVDVQKELDVTHFNSFLGDLVFTVNGRLMRDDDQIFALDTLFFPIAVTEKPRRVFFVWEGSRESAEYIIDLDADVAHVIEQVRAGNIHELELRLGDQVLDLRARFLAVVPRWKAVKICELPLEYRLPRKFFRVKDDRPKSVDEGVSFSGDDVQVFQARDEMTIGGMKDRLRRIPEFGLAAFTLDRLIFDVGGTRYGEADDGWLLSDIYEKDRVIVIRVQGIRYSFDDSGTMHEMRFHEDMTVKELFAIWWDILGDCHVSLRQGRKPDRKRGDAPLHTAVDVGAGPIVVRAKDYRFRFILLPGRVEAKMRIPLTETLGQLRSRAKYVAGTHEVEFILGERAAPALVPSHRWLAAWAEKPSSSFAAWGDETRTFGDIRGKKQASCALISLTLLDPSFRFHFAGREEKHGFRYTTLVVDAERELGGLIKADVRFRSDRFFRPTTLIMEQFARDQAVVECDKADPLLVFDLPAAADPSLIAELPGDGNVRHAYHHIRPAATVGEAMALVLRRYPTRNLVVSYDNKKLDRRTRFRDLPDGGRALHFAVQIQVTSTFTIQMPDRSTFEVTLFGDRPTLRELAGELPPQDYEYDLLQLGRPIRELKPSRRCPIELRPRGRDFDFEYDGQKHRERLRPSLRLEDLSDECHWAETPTDMYFKVNGVVVHPARTLESLPAETVIQCLTFAEARVLDTVGKLRAMFPAGSRRIYRQDGQILPRSALVTPAPQEWIDVPVDPNGSLEVAFALPGDGEWRVYFGLDQPICDARYAVADYLNDDAAHVALYFNHHKLVDEDLIYELGTGELRIEARIEHGDAEVQFKFGGTGREDVWVTFANRTITPENAKKELKLPAEATVDFAVRGRLLLAGETFEVPPEAAVYVFEAQAEPAGPARPPPTAVFRVLLPEVREPVDFAYRPGMSVQDAKRLIAAGQDNWDELDFDLWMMPREPLLNEADPLPIGDGKGALFEVRILKPLVPRAIVEEEARKHPGKTRESRDAIRTLWSRCGEDVELYRAHCRDK